MTFNQYVEEVKKRFIRGLIEPEDIKDAERYFNTDEAQDKIKQDYEYYISKDEMLVGGAKPEAVANCLNLMWH